MEKFTFISKAPAPGEDASFSLRVIHSPDENYSIIMRYYRNNGQKEGEYKTSNFPNVFSEVFIYIRHNDEDDYAAFEYSGHVCVSRSVKNNVRYDVIKNIEDITADIQNEWKELIECVKKVEDTKSNP